ncbi:hypothetical protein pb186bvf_000173 [Paramecium bursaria]
MSSKSASRSRSKNKDDRRVYVTGFSTSNTREEDIRTAFSKFGEIQDLSWKGRFCFIAYAKAEDASEAITQMHQQEMSGHKLLVEQAKSLLGIVVIAVVVAIIVIEDEAPVHPVLHPEIRRKRRGSDPPDPVVQIEKL